MRSFKKALITGINGSGGSFLAEHIIKKNSNIDVHGTIRSNNISNIIEIRKNISIHKCDLNSFNNIKKILNKIKPDVIFHIASNADVRGSFDFPMEIINNNNNCTLNLLESIRILKINPLILICSTSEVYGQVSKNKLKINELEQIKPINPYAVSKTFQDLLAYNYFLNYKLKIVITRMFTYINPRRLNLFASHWAYQIARIEQGKQKYLMHGNLKSTRTILGIDDAMEAYWLAAKKGKIGEIYNMGGSKKITIKKILEIMINKSKVKIITKLDKKLLRKTDIYVQVPDSSKFKEHTNWKYNENLDASIDKLLFEMRKRVLMEN